MKQFSLWFTIFFTAAVLSSFVLAQNNTPKKDNQQNQDTSKASVLYTCPMHSDVKSNKPGECPKCGMELVAINEQPKGSMKKMPMEQQHDTSTMTGKKHGKVMKGKKHGTMMMEMKHDSSSMAQGKKRNRKAFMDKKFALNKAGKYHCCIDGACNECVDEGECTCAMAVKNNKPVCDECYKGWKNCDGMVKGKTLKDIRHEEHRDEEKK